MTEMELRVRTTNWPREHVEAAENALRNISHADHTHIYEIATNHLGEEIPVSSLRKFYEEDLPENEFYEEMRQQAGELIPWNELEQEQILELACIMETDQLDPQLPALQLAAEPDSAAGLAELLDPWLTPA